MAMSSTVVYRTCPTLLPLQPTTMYQSLVLICPPSPPSIKTSDVESNCPDFFPALMSRENAFQTTSLGRRQVVTVRVPPSVPCCGLFNRPNWGIPGPMQMPELEECDWSGNKYVPQKVLGMQSQEEGCTIRMAGQPYLFSVGERILESSIQAG